MKQFWRYLGLILLAFLAIGTLGFVLWANNPMQPEAQALKMLSANQGVNYAVMDGSLIFSPSIKEPNTALIFYPGARVDPRAYAPHAKAIAEAGFTVIIVPMPLNFAFLGVNRAADVIASFPGIDNWAIGGHSLGGAMAAEFAAENLETLDGLVLWASYSAENTNLANSGLSVISIHASNDGLATLQDIANSRERLPMNTDFIEISGGNHAGFGWYGSQNGDGEAQISKAEQQSQIVSATVEFLSIMGND